jgi:hypothetical protein
MTSRERIFTALKGEKVDRIPWIPLCYRDFFLSIPEYKRKFPLKWQEGEAVSEDLEQEELKFRVDFYNNIGADFMNWGPMGCVKTEMKNVRTKRRHSGNNLYIEYKTPNGVLEETFLFSEPSQTLFRKDFLLRRDKDFEVYRYILENTLLKPDVIKAQIFLDIVGEKGVIFLDGIAPPLHYLLNDLLGIEALSYALFDEKKEVLEILEIQESLNLERCRMLAALPMQIFLHQAVWDVGNISPLYYEKYYLPPLKFYNSILHKHGKICLDHLSGQKIKNYLKLIEKSGLDALYGLNYPSLPGDIPISELIKRWMSKGLIPVVGLNCDFLVSTSESKIAEMTKRFLDETGGKPVILGTADDVVYGTEVKKLEVVSDTIRKFYG